MRTLLWGILLELVMTQTNANTGTIRGKVTRADGVEPIADVQILLVGPLTGAAANAAVSNPLMLAEIAEGSNTPQFGVLTKSDGSFSFSNLPPGQYTLRGQRDGYFSPAVARTRSVVTASLNVTSTSTVEVPLTMLKGATISGQVLNSSGEPAANYVVNVYQPGYYDGREMLEAAGVATTNDRGEYRLFGLAPGSYHIGAAPAGAPRTPLAAISGSEPCCRIFYPGVRNAATVSPQIVHEGAELTGRDFDFRGLSTFKVSGHLSNRPAEAATADTTTSVNLQPRETDALLTGMKIAFPFTVNADGSFVIQNVPSGSYDVLATIVDRSSKLWNGRTSIEVGNQDRDDVHVAIHPGAEVKVRILLDDILQANPTVRVQLRSRDVPATVFSAVRATGAALDTSSAYAISNVPEGAYRVSVGGIPVKFYVADIRQGAASIFDSGLVIHQEGSIAIDVLLRSGAASIRGNVLGSDGKPAAGATVVLVPSLARRQNSLLYRTTGAERSGAFNLDGVPPGNYKLFAWETVPNNAYMNEKFMEGYEARGQFINVEPGSSSTVTLTVISRNLGTESN